MICPRCGNRMLFQEEVMGRRLMRCAVCGLRLFEARTVCGYAQVPDGPAVASE